MREEGRAHRLRDKGERRRVFRDGADGEDHRVMAGHGDERIGIVSTGGDQPAGRILPEPQAGEPRVAIGSMGRAVGRQVEFDGRMAGGQDGRLGARGQRCNRR